MTQRVLVPVGFAVLLILVAGLALAQTGEHGRATIRVFQFEPAALHVRPGGRVTWTNHDDITHTATSGSLGRPDGRFDVPLEGKGASGGVTFASAGVYPYFCVRHPSMRGEVVVR